jgi:ABC-type sugar transport system permease subunit
MRFLWVKPSGRRVRADNKGKQVVPFRPSIMLGRRKVMEKITLLAFLTPALLFVLIFIAYPIFYAGYLSFTQFNYAIDSKPTFIGIKGYTDTLFNDRFFLIALVNQAKFAIPYFAVSFFLSLVLAILLNELVRHVNLFQAIFYLPMIVPLSLVAVMLLWILEPDLGIVNATLRRVGLTSLTQDWLGDPKVALYSLVGGQIWKMLGFTLIIFLSGLQGLPKSLRDAAKVDGANFFQEVWHIILPNLKPYMLVCGIWITINSFKVFDLPAVATFGGPGHATLTLYLYSWKAAFERLDMGKAAVVAFVTAFIILFISWILNRIFKPEVAETHG